MITASDNRYSAWVHTLNGIAKLSSNNSFELHISKVAPFSQNQGPPKINSGPGQSGPRTMNATGVIRKIPSDQIVCEILTLVLTMSIPH